MVRETSVVTPERFSEGFTYESYIEQIKVNKARFDEFYNSFGVTADDAEALKELSSRPNGPAKMLVLGEDWCGDVIRGLPVPGPHGRGRRLGNERIPQGPAPRHHERVPQERTVDVHPRRGVLYQGPPVHLPLDRAPGVR